MDLCRRPAKTTHDLHQDRQARPAACIPTDQPPAEQSSRRLQAAHVARLDRRVVAACDAKIEEQPVDRELVIPQVRFRPNHTDHPLGEAYRLANQLCCVHRSERGETSEARRVDMGDDHRHLIHVGRNHDPGCAAGMRHRVQSAKRRSLKTVSMVRDFPGNPSTDGIFPSGRTPDARQLVDKLLIAAFLGGNAPPTALYLRKAS